MHGQKNIKLLLECIKYTSCRWPFKGWNMVEWRVVLASDNLVKYGCICRYYSMHFQLIIPAVAAPVFRDPCTNRINRITQSNFQLTQTVYLQEMWRSITWTSGEAYVTTNGTCGRPLSSVVSWATNAPTEWLTARCSDPPEVSFLTSVWLIPYATSRQVSRHRFRNYIPFFHGGRGGQNQSHVVEQRAKEWGRSGSYLVLCSVNNCTVVFHIHTHADTMCYLWKLIIRRCHVILMFVLKGASVLFTEKDGC